MDQSSPASPRARRPGPAGRRLRIPSLLRGFRNWRQLGPLLRRVVKAADEDDVDIVAAGLAFYGLFGLFPTLLAIVSLYGLIADPADVQQVLTSLSEGLPEQARIVMMAGLSDFVARSTGRLSLSLALSLVVLLYSASTAMSALVRAINVAYDLPERRSFFKRRGVAILATVGGIVGFAVIIPIVAALPKILGFLHFQTAASLPWVVLTVLAFVALLVLYRYAPDRDTPPPLRGTLPGAIVASALWAVAGSLYSVYVRNFSAYSSTYGALEGVIVLQFWLFISALILLYGAELNAELERAHREQLAR